MRTPRASDRRAPRASDAELAEYYRRTLPLQDYIPYVSPGFASPRHLGPLTELLERCEREPVRAVVATAPGFFKTETFLHGCVRLLDRDPTFTIAYLSYAADFAATKCSRAKLIARRAGLSLSGRDREDHFETPAGGFMLSSGIRGQVVGKRFRLVGVDDPVKNREEAESQTLRDKTYDAFTSDVLTREDLRGTSFLVVHTPWHTDDLGQRLVAKGWPFIRLPAIGDDGTSLAPEHWPIERLEQKRLDHTAYEWESLYQCRPVPRGSAVFEPPTYYEQHETPRDGFSAAFGLDGAYSAKTSADWSEWLLARVKRQADGRPVLYLADELHMQAAQPVFVEACKARVSEYPGARGAWYTSTTERGNADLMTQLGLPVVALPARADKFVRAQAVAAAWNAGRIRVPRWASWAPAFVEEVCRFTGLGDRHDDRVDALAALYDFVMEHDTSDYKRMVRSLKSVTGRR